MTPLKPHIMNLETKSINQSLSAGYTSEAFQKKGERMTVVAMFSGITGGTTAKLQQSVDGSAFQDIPESEATLEAGQENQMWNDGILPEGAFVRIVVGTSSGQLSTVKILS